MISRHVCAHREHIELTLQCLCVQILRAHQTYTRVHSLCVQHTARTARTARTELGAGG